MIASLLVFGLAQAENRAEKSTEESDRRDAPSSSEYSEEERAKKDQEEKARERFRAQQSIQRALRDQGLPHGPVYPSAPSEK